MSRLNSRFEAPCSEKTISMAPDGQTLQKHLQCNRSTALVETCVNLGDLDMACFTAKDWSGVGTEQSESVAGSGARILMCVEITVYPFHREKRVPPRMAR